MSRADDLLSNVQKAVGDKPFVLLAGAGDLVSEKLRELPDVVSAWQAENRDFPMKAAGVLVGTAFRANLKVGELYDELTRRGQDVMTKMRGDDVVAEEDEPFLHEPFMPEPVRRVSAPTAKKTAAAKNGTAKQSAATKNSAATNSAATKKSAGTKKSAAKTKSAAKKSAAPKKRTTKSAARKTAATEPGFAQ